MTTTTLVAKQGDNLATADIMSAVGRFLRLHTADGDASPATLWSDSSRKASRLVA